MDKLPEELLYGICGVLQTKDLISVSCVSRRLRSAATSIAMNRHISFKNSWGVPSVAINQYISRYSKGVVKLDLQNCYWLKSSELAKSLVKCVSLTSLDVTGCSVGVDVIITILQNNVKLEHLGWSIDQNTMKDTACPSIYLRNPVVCQLYRDLHAAIKNVTSLKLSFFQGKSFGFVDKQPMSVLLYLILRELHLHRLEISWPKGKGVLFEPHQMVFENSGDKNFISFKCTGILHPNNVNLSQNTGQFWNMFFASVICSPTKKTCILPYSGTPTSYPLSTVFSNPVCSCIKQGEHSPEQVLVHYDISGYRSPSEYHLALLRQESLRYLNLSSCHFIDGNALIGVHYPHLESLNLQGCKNSWKPDLSGLKSLMAHSLHLKHLNLANIDFQQILDGSTNELVEILSKCKSLVSLSLPVIWSISTMEDMATEGQNSFTPKVEQLVKNATGNQDNKRNYLAPMAAESGQPCLGLGTGASSECTARLPTFQTLVNSCHLMREFELIHTGFHSVIGSTYPATLSCPNCRCAVLPGEMLKSIGNWKYLKRLTLAGLTLSGSAEFLVIITRQCTSLEYLSLACLAPTLSHSGGITSLYRALLHCHSLKDFRLEHPYFNITKRFLDSLHQAQNLERVCLVTRKGTLSKKELVPWLNKCRKVIFLQVFCDITKKDCKEIKKDLEARYSKSRPGFFVGLFGYSILECIKRTAVNNFETQDQELSFKTPTVHLHELSIFTTRVATNWRV